MKKRGEFLTVDEFKKKLHFHFEQNAFICREIQVKEINF